MARAAAGGRLRPPHPPGALAEAAAGEAPRRLRERHAPDRVLAAVAGYGAAAPYCTAPDPFTRPRPLTRDYDEKALVEIYRAILASGEATPVVTAARLPAAV